MIQRQFSITTLFPAIHLQLFNTTQLHTGQGEVNSIEESLPVDSVTFGIFTRLFTHLLQNIGANDRRKVTRGISAPRIESRIWREAVKLIVRQGIKNGRGDLLLLSPSSLMALPSVSYLYTVVQTSGSQEPLHCQSPRQFSTTSSIVLGVRIRIRMERRTTRDVLWFTHMSYARRTCLDSYLLI